MFYPNSYTEPFMRRAAVPQPPPPLLPAAYWTCRGRGGGQRRVDFTPNRILVSFRADLLLSCRAPPQPRAERAAVQAPQTEADPMDRGGDRVAAGGRQDLRRRQLGQDTRPLSIPEPHFRQSQGPLEKLEQVTPCCSFLNCFILSG